MQISCFSTWKPISWIFDFRGASKNKALNTWNIATILGGKNGPFQAAKFESRICCQTKLLDHLEGQFRYISEELVTRHVLFVERCLWLWCYVDVTKQKLPSRQLISNNEPNTSSGLLDINFWVLNYGIATRKPEEQRKFDTCWVGQLATGCAFGSTKVKHPN